MLKFAYLEKGGWVPEGTPMTAYLKRDTWDDYGFKTSFELLLRDEDDVFHNIGPVKIGFKGQVDGQKPTPIPSSFEELEPHYFSLGQGPEYYSKLMEFDEAIRVNLLLSLRDIAHDRTIYPDIADEAVLSDSLLRGSSPFTIGDQYRRILDGGDIRTVYHFGFDHNPSASSSNKGLIVDFLVDPDSNPPSNVHVLIGSNGVGKTKLLTEIAEIVASDFDTEELQRLVWRGNDDASLFAGVVFVSFSAFDPFDPRVPESDQREGIKYTYVGLRNLSVKGRGTYFRRHELDEQFQQSGKHCLHPSKIKSWKTALKLLEADPGFAEYGLSEALGRGDYEKTLGQSFSSMSSGHRIVLLAVARMVEHVHEKTLVLIDEPETHLHPPLLSAYVRAISELMKDRNGVAIVATHSPVVLQEVPAKCVWILTKAGGHTNAERPEQETFGENAGILTHEVFRLEVRQSGFYRLVKDAASTHREYETAARAFKWALGSEAKALLRAAVSNTDDEG